MNIIIYVHGKGGNALEANHYKEMFPSYKVIGLEYTGSTPWEVGKEIHEEINKLQARYDKIILIANSIGAYYCMNGDIDEYIDHAYFISPIVDMEKLIQDMMNYLHISEIELKREKTIHTKLGEDLSWDYLNYVKKHPISWNVSTDVLYGSNDHMTSYDTMSSFVKRYHASLTILQDGEHWFHTDGQMEFLDNWIKKKLGEEYGI